MSYRRVTIDLSKWYTSDGKAHHTGMRSLIKRLEGGPEVDRKYREAQKEVQAMFASQERLRLSDEEIQCLYYEAHGKAVCEIDYRNAFNKAFANAVQDALIAKNGGKV